jgi:hypothetical protein
MKSQLTDRQFFIRRELLRELRRLIAEAEAAAENSKKPKDN